MYRSVRDRTLEMFRKVLFLLLSVSVLHAEPAQVGKTGQTKCYNASGTEISCTGTGQDGEIRAGVAWPNPRFSISGDCVTDNLTGLMWAKNANLPNSTKHGSKPWTMLHL
jgi:hypothetical protein